MTGHAGKSSAIHAQATQNGDEKPKEQSTEFAAQGTEKCALEKQVVRWRNDSKGLWLMSTTAMHDERLMEIVCVRNMRTKQSAWRRWFLKLSATHGSDVHLKLETRSEYPEQAGGIHALCWKHVVMLYWRWCKANIALQCISDSVNEMHCSAKPLGQLFAIILCCRPISSLFRDDLLRFFSPFFLSTDDCALRRNVLFCISNFLRFKEVKEKIMYIYEKTLITPKTYNILRIIRVGKSAVIARRAVRDVFQSRQTHLLKLPVRRTHCK